MSYFAIFASKNDFIQKFASFRGDVCKDFSKILLMKKQGLYFMKTDVASKAVENIKILH